MNVMIESGLRGDVQRGSWEAGPRLIRGHKSNRKQFCDAKDATMQGLGKGDTFHWNIYSDVATQGTVLPETNVMPETNFTIDQGTLTIDQLGNSVKKLAAIGFSLFSTLINAFDAIVIGSFMTVNAECN